jgi:hypothetical protein
MEKRMTKLKKGDRVWVSGNHDGIILAQEVTVKSAGENFVVLDDRAKAVRYLSKIPRSKVFPGSEEAVLVVREALRRQAARLEQEARDLRATADSEPQIERLKA